MRLTGGITSVKRDDLWLWFSIVAFAQLVEKGGIATVSSKWTSKGSCRDDSNTVWWTNGDRIERLRDEKCVNESCFQ